MTRSIDSADPSDTAIQCHAMTARDALKQATAAQVGERLHRFETFTDAHTIAVGDRHQLAKALADIPKGQEGLVEDRPKPAA